MPLKKRAPALATRAAREIASFGRLDVSKNSQKAAIAQVVVEFEKSSRETFQLFLGRYRNCDVADIRAWWGDADGRASTRPKWHHRLGQASPAASLGIERGACGGSVPGGVLSPEVGEPEPSDEARP